MPKIFTKTGDKGETGRFDGTRVPKNEKKAYNNMWYIPFEEQQDIENSLRFTLSKDLAATVHAGDVKFFSKTIEFVRSHKEILPPDENEIASMIQGVKPIFTHPEESLS